MATTALPVLPLLLGSLVMIIKALNNYPRTVVSSREIFANKMTNQLVHDKVGLL